MLAIPYMAKLLRGKLSCLDRKMATHRKTLAVAYLWIYVANQQSIIFKKRFNLPLSEKP